jgi:hypothetical protein
MSSDKHGECGSSVNGQQRVRPSLGSEIETFSDHVNALATSFPLMLLLMHGNERLRNKEYLRFLEERGELVEVDQDNKEYSVPLDCLRETDRLKRCLTQAEIGAAILPRSFLVSLVSTYDFFLGRILQCLYRLRPELLNVSEKQLTYSQLLRFGSIEQAKEYLLEKEVESVLRDSHADQFIFLENKFSVQLRKDLPVWKDFIELTERRNLFVHCNGVVSSQYIAVCNAHGITEGLPVLATNSMLSRTISCARLTAFTKSA